MHRRQLVSIHQHIVIHSTTISLVLFSLLSGISFAQTFESPVVDAPTTSVTHHSNDSAVQTLRIASDKDSKLSNKLKEMIDHYMERDPHRLGIIVVDEEQRKTILSANSDAHFHPASNIKLLTSAAALVTLGPRYRWKTQFFGKNRVEDSIDDLVVVGSGDPSYSYDDLAKAVRALKENGIRRIQTQIVLDDSNFKFEGLPPGFSEKNQDGAYRPAISAFNLNWNQIEIAIYGSSKKKPKVSVFPSSSWIRVKNRTKTTSRVRRPIQVGQTYHKNYQLVSLKGQIKSGQTQRYRRRVDNPTQHFCAVIKRVLSHYDVQFDGTCQRGKKRRGSTLLFSHFSRTLDHILRDVNAWSNNLTAEALVYAMGDANGSTKPYVVGLNRVRSFAKTQIGWDQFRLHNGSGLFGRTAVSPRQLADLLSFMYRNLGAYPEYPGSLAVSEDDGTLKNRFKGLRGVKILGKTGTLDGVSGLSGYIVIEKNKWFSFSILQNDFKNSSLPIRKLQDEILSAIVEWLRRHETDSEE